MITIVDYGMGNLASLRRAFACLGQASEVTSDPEAVAQADKLILPGVGAFGKAMENLQQAGLDQAVRQYAQTDRPLLGICLGLQLLCASGEEGGALPGLALINATTKKLPPGEKVPHVGWNRVSITRDQPLFKGISAGAYFYFVHSYYVQPEDTLLQSMTTCYGIKFCSAVSRGNLAGVQFHPEKSGAVGLQLLSNFATM